MKIELTEEEVKLISNCLEHEQDLLATRWNFYETTNKVDKKNEVGKDFGNIETLLSKLNP